MESSTILPLSQLSFFPPKSCTPKGASPFRPWKQRTSQPARFNCQKMVWGSITRSQGSQQPPQFLHLYCKQSYNPEAYKELMEFLSTHALNNGDKFCADLMRESPRHRSLALRILEVRSAYCKRDFEWENLKRLASKMVDESNTRLMRDYVLETSHEES